MQTSTLFNKFSQSVNWNGFFYTIYKTFSTALSFLLFKYLTTQDFSTWANINSIIFLLLLWLDFGLRKSIPRYLPEFAKDSNAHHRFIKYLIYFQIAVLMVSIPLYMYLTHTMTNLLNLDKAPFLFYIGSALFVTEGMVGLLRLIYHAHFWNKQFNLLSTVALLCEMTANMVLIMTSTHSMHMLQGIFVTKLLSGLIIIVASIGMLRRLYKDRNYKGTQIIDFDATMKSCIKHSGIMWMNNNIKSLTERNFLVPFFTYTLGPVAANLFKVANDGALFFYRILLKTIGTTDTALLAHVLATKEKEKLTPIAFKKLTSKVASLCIPVLGILLLLFLKRDIFFNNPCVFQTFFIITIGYMIEFMVCPYERVLEVNRRYWLLLFAYMPYIIMIVCLFLINHMTCIGLITSLLLIHGVRLVSSFIMVYLTRTRYLLYYPFAYACYVLGICIPIYIGLYLLLSFTPITMLSEYIVSINPLIKPTLLSSG